MGVSFEIIAVALSALSPGPATLLKFASPAAIICAISLGSFFSLAIVNALSTTATTFSAVSAPLKSAIGFAPPAGPSFPVPGATVTSGPACATGVSLFLSKYACLSPGFSTDLPLPPPTAFAIALSVLGPGSPSGLRPFDVWKSLTAFAVPGPNQPSAFAGNPNWVRAV